MGAFRSRCVVVSVGCFFAAGAGVVVVACGGSDASAPGGTGGAAVTGTGGEGAGGVVGSGGVGSGGDLSGTGNMTSTGGVTTGTGGTSSGGTPATGGTTTSGDYTFVGTVQAAPGTTANASLVGAFTTSCESDTCSSAHCVPQTVLDSQAPGQSALLGDCPSTDGTVSKCVPDDFIATLGQFVLKTCTSIIGAEGRCISTCVPQVEAQMDQLPQDVCDETERCAPCYLPYPPDPGQSDESGACSVGVGDAPTQPKVTFALCGYDRGLCVPKDLVPTNLQSALPVDTCSGTDELCAPIEKVKDLNYKFPSCYPQLSGLGMDMTQPAACVPKYIVDYQAMTNAFASSLTQSNCTNSGDICAPCTDPLSGMTTGACE